jgi:hypothetical protein
MSSFSITAHDQQFFPYTAHRWVVATSMSTYNIILLIDEQFSYYNAHHWAVATSMSTYIVASLPLPLYCGILLLAGQHETKLVSILYCSSMNSSCIILLIIEQLWPPCSSWSSYCNILYPRSLLYLSQWELAKLYWCVVWWGLGAWWLPCHYMTSLSFIAALCRLLWLRHHANFTAAWAAAVTSISSYIFIVASLPLPHSCGIMLLWKQYETIQGLSCGITPTLIAASLPTRFVVW